jgi:hypothetical protein
MVPLTKVDGQHFIDESLTQAQVREAIIAGAENARWSTEDLRSDYILATYHIRVHTVHVKIVFTNTFYIAHYESSDGMKMFCSEKDMEKNRNMIVSGRKKCPDNRLPSYIHKGYKKWVDSLNVAIQNSLASM